MRIGSLDQRIEIERPEVAVDDFGGQTITGWTVIATVWASIDVAGGGEQREGEKVVARARLLVTIRHRDDVTAQMRIRHGPRIYQIETVGAASRRRGSQDGMALSVVETQD